MPWTPLAPILGLLGLAAFGIYRYVVAQPGPSMNILIKLMSVVALVLAPLFR